MRNGFARFLGIDDEVAMEKYLNTICIWNMRLFVNLPKYEKTWNKAN